MAEHRGKSLLLNHFIPYRMVNLAKRISDSCADIYRDDFGISIPEWRILARLAEHDAQNSRCLGQVTFMDKSKVSRAVKQLDSKGYLSKRKDRDDNRVTYLSLTKAGRRLYHEIVPRALDWEKRLISALDIDEYRDLMRVLEKLERRLEVMDTPQ